MTEKRRRSRRRKGVPVQAYIDKDLFFKFTYHYRSHGAIARLIRAAFEAAVAERQSDLELEKALHDYQQTNSEHEGQGSIG